ncbi:MAG: tetratricopeptide repeat protein, partial [Candidatus Entotheonellia bacterium]
VELVSRLRHDKLQLERKHQEAEQRIAELEGEVKRLMAPRETTPPATDDLRDRLQLERKHHEAEQRIAELEGEVKRLMAERHVMPPALGSLPQSSNTLADDHQGQTVHRLLELLGKEPANVKALFELGNIYERQGMYEKAILEYRKALNIDADFVDAIEHLAFLLEKLNRDNEASPLWERILSLKKRR